MKIKSNVLFGLIVLICSISGFSLLKRMTREIDEWRPSDLYSSSNLSRRSTFSVVSSAPASYSSAVATVSSGSGSMFRHGGVSLYAPALSVSNSQLPMAGTASYGQSPIAYGQRLHTTSSAEFRSFGGGGNVGGVSMSGGSVKSSGSSVVPASGLSVSMPSTSMYAYNTNRNGLSATDVMASVSGDIAMASSYQGVSGTYGGSSRSLSGRKDAAPTNNAYNSWLLWLQEYGYEYGADDGSGTYTYDYEAAWEAFLAWLDTPYGQAYAGSDPTIVWDLWFSWCMSNSGTHTYGDNIYKFLPIGDYVPLLVMALLYVGYIAIRRRNKCENINTLN